MRERDQALVSDPGFSRSVLVVDICQLALNIKQLRRVYRRKVLKGCPGKEAWTKKKVMEVKTKKGSQHSTDPGNHKASILNSL